MAVVDTGLECATAPIFFPMGLATAEEIKAVGGDENGSYCYVEQVQDVSYRKVATGFETWEINIWGFDHGEVEARTAKLQAFLDSRRIK